PNFCQDLQTVGINLRVLYRPERKALPKIFKSLGVDFAEKVLPSLGNEVLKQIVVGLFFLQKLYLFDNFPFQKNRQNMMLLNYLLREISYVIFFQLIGY